MKISSFGRQLRQRRQRRLQLVEQKIIRRLLSRKIPAARRVLPKKIRGDLKKVVSLRGAGEYEIEEWIFVTPAPLPREAQSYLMTWLGLRGDGSGFSVKQGSAEEFASEAAAVARGKSITVDLLALFTLTELKKTGLLPKIFDRVLVHQAVVDALGNLIREMSGYAERGGTYSFGKNAVGGYEVSRLLPEVYAVGAEFLEKVKEFVKTMCETTGFARELDEDESALVQTLGWAAASPVIFARQKQIALLSDDGILRHRMREEMAIESFSSYALFAFAAERGNLSQNAFDDLSVLMLVDLNYRFAPIAARALMRCAAKEGFRARQKFDRAVVLLCESGADIESMATVLAQFVALPGSKKIRGCSNAV